MKQITEHINNLKAQIRKLELQLVTQEVPEETVTPRIEKLQAQIQVLEKKLKNLNVLVQNN